MSSSSPNAGMQVSAPLVDGIGNHVLLQSGPDLNQLLSQLVHVLHFFGRRDLASLHKSCDLLGWDLGYLEATDQVRWMQPSPVATCSSLIVSRALCAGALSCWNISQGVQQHIWGEVGSSLIILLHSSNWLELSTSVKDMDKSIVSPFLTHGVDICI